MPQYLDHHPTNPDMPPELVAHITQRLESGQPDEFGQVGRHVSSAPSRPGATPRHRPWRRSAGPTRRWASTSIPRPWSRCRSCPNAGLRDRDDARPALLLQPQLRSPAEPPSHDRSMRSGAGWDPGGMATADSRVTGWFSWLIAVPTQWPGHRPVSARACANRSGSAQQPPGGLRQDLDMHAGQDRRPQLREPRSCDRLAIGLEQPDERDIERLVDVHHPREGWVTANTVAMIAANECPTMTGRSSPASWTASATAAATSSGSHLGGRGEPPWPGRSSTNTCRSGPPSRSAAMAGSHICGGRNVSPCSSTNGGRSSGRPSSKPRSFAVPKARA